VGRALGIPYVNLCAGHAMDPAAVDDLLANHPRVAVSDACRRAVDALRTRHGIADASPFLYLTGVSPHLNLYCEPPEFLTAAQRRSFEPVAFYGSLPPASDLEARARTDVPGPFGEAAALKVYACFGTVVWRYWAADAFAALQAVSAALSEAPGARGLISLGGARLDSARRSSLKAPNVEVAEYVEQMRVLDEADVLITHHGLNSTHEAIYNRVPMLSYPFLSDQPGLAATCARLGLAVRLAESVRGPLSAEAIGRGLDELAANDQEIGRRLDEARGWELRVLDERPSVVERISELARH
jgi:UDP:flavonoid glycosyltransferase YjiC (YdhE family)